jgi:hypothetical protein
MESDTEKKTTSPAPDGQAEPTKADVVAALVAALQCLRALDIPRGGVIDSEGRATLERHGFDWSRRMEITPKKWVMAKADAALALAAKAEA